MFVYDIATVMYVIGQCDTLGCPRVIGCRQPYLVESWVPTEEGEYRGGWL